MKNFFKRNKKRMFAVAFKEIGQNKIQVDVMDSQSLSYLSIDWAFKVLSVKEIWKNFLKKYLTNSFSCDIINTEQKREVHRND